MGKPRTQPQCQSCGIAWADACERRHVDIGITSIDTCVRCGKNVCAQCGPRYSDAATQGEACARLCPTCWNLPQPTIEDARAHPLAKSHGADYAFFVMQHAEWRYAPPAGQICSINPLEVWFHREYPFEIGVSREKMREHERMYDIATLHQTPLLFDTWLPHWAIPLIDLLLREREIPPSAWDDDTEKEDLAEAIAS